MPTGTHIAETQDALEKLLASKLPGVTVRGLTGGDFEEETGRLIVAPPAVLVVLTREDLESRRDHMALTYQSAQRFQIICGGKSLRTDAEGRVLALELLSKVCDVLAGARLTLNSSTQQPIVRLQSGVSLGQLDQEDVWYALPIAVESVAQFSANAT